MKSEIIMMLQVLDTMLENSLDNSYDYTEPYINLLSNIQVGVKDSIKSLRNTPAAYPVDEVSVDTEIMNDVLSELAIDLNKSVWICEKDYIVECYGIDENGLYRITDQSFNHKEDAMEYFEAEMCKYDKVILKECTVICEKNNDYDEVG